jgi:NADP-dependent 3-hydroxy acid dehydrogenase YdfG
MVETEFSIRRFGGDRDRAAAVYAGAEPLTADDVAEAVTWVVTRPARVNVDSMLLLARDQTSAQRVHRRNS